MSPSPASVNVSSATLRTAMPIIYDQDLRHVSVLSLFNLRPYVVLAIAAQPLKRHDLDILSFFAKTPERSDLTRLLGRI